MCLLTELIKPLRRGDPEKTTIPLEFVIGVYDLNIIYINGTVLIADIEWNVQELLQNVVKQAIRKDKTSVEKKYTVVSKK